MREYPKEFLEEMAHDTLARLRRLDARQGLDPEPQRLHDSDPLPEPHEESCGCHWCSPKPAYRSVNGIPFERITIDPKALTFAADEYAASTGHVDEIALGHAILGYLEAERS